MPFVARLRIVCAIFALALSIIISQAQRQATLTIYAATSLTDAFEDLAAAFLLERPDAHIVLNFASSSKLAAQLLAGAPADIFASANSSQMDRLLADGRISAGAVRSFASNRLALIVPADNPAGITAISDLGRKPHWLVLAVTGSPIRDYTNAMFASHNEEFGQDFSQNVLANLVSEESNVRQVVARIALGEADAGIVYQTDLTAEIRDAVLRLPIADRHNQIASYPIALLADSPQPALAAAFVEFVLSEAAQSILRGYGFCAPASRAPTAQMPVALTENHNRVVAAHGSEPTAKSSADKTHEGQLEDHPEIHLEDHLENQVKAALCEGRQAEG